MTRRLLGSYLVVTAFVLAVTAIPLGRTTARSERARLISAVERDALVLATVVEDALEDDVAVPLAPVADRYAQRTGARVVVLDADGISRADSDPLSTAPRDFSTRDEVRAALTGRIASGDRFSETLDTGLLYVAVPVASGGLVHGAVRITYPTAALDARIRRSWLTLAAIGAVALLASALVAAGIARWVSRPVRRLEAAAQRLASGDLRARGSTGEGPPEIRALARTLDLMAHRLESLLDSQRAFVADASHQLRSPLAALRLRLEGIDGLTSSQQAQVEAALDESARLARLLDGLLTLARAEGSRAQLRVVDVAAVLRQRADAWDPLGAEMGVAVEVDVDDASPALAVPGALEQILDNYLANALNVAPKRSTVTLRARDRDDGVVVSVVDRGPGMSPNDRRRAFDRFWRGDEQETDGFGLGLAIVARLAAASGGEAHLAEAPGGRGIEASVTLPHATPSARSAISASQPVNGIAAPSP